MKELTLKIRSNDEPYYSRWTVEQLLKDVNEKYISKNEVKQAIQALTGDEDGWWDDIGKINAKELLKRLGL